MVISITSPVHGQAGNTTAALLISLLLSEENSVCLTHLSALSSSFYTYLGLQKLDDPLCTPSQVVNLLRAKTITPEELKDYCKKANYHLDIFSNNSKGFTDEDMQLTAQYILEKMPHDFIVLDIDVNTSNAVVQAAFEKSDLIVVAMTQMINVFERYKEVFGDNKCIKDKSVYFVNHFSNEVGSLRAFAKQIGVSQRICCPLRHSETLIKLSNNGRLADIASSIKNEDMLDIKSDLTRLKAIIYTNSKNNASMRETQNEHK